jgi:hypothetical protein
MDSRTLDTKIEDLRYLFLDAKSGDAPWKDVWAKVAEIREGFRSARYASRDAHNIAWDRFQAILSDMAEQQQEFTRSSQNVRANIEDLLKNARYFDPNDALTNILGAMIPVAQVGFVLDPVTTRERDILRIRSKFLKDAWEMFKTNRMTTEDRNAVYADLRETQSILDGEWEDWKSASARHREERIESNIDRNLERIEKLQSVLANKEEHLARFEDQRDNARTEEFRIAMEEKIESISEQIEDIKRKIEELEAYVEQDRKKL